MIFGSCFSSNSSYDKSPNLEFFPDIFFDICIKRPTLKIHLTHFCEINGYYLMALEIFRGHEFHLTNWGIFGPYLNTLVGEFLGVRMYTNSAII